MSDSLELRKSKHRVMHAVMEEFLTLCEYDQEELIDTVFGEMVDMQNTGRSDNDRVKKIHHAKMRMRWYDGHLR